MLLIGDRLRVVREGKKLSQAEIEGRTGLLRSYISRVENGHTVPSIETLGKIAGALELPLYQLFYDGEEPPLVPSPAERRARDKFAWGNSGKEARELSRLRRHLSRTQEPDRRLLLQIAQRMARTRQGKSSGNPLISQ